jgi:hypothetical protein
MKRLLGESQLFCLRTTRTEAEILVLPAGRKTVEKLVTITLRQSGLGRRKSRLGRSFLVVAAAGHQQGSKTKADHRARWEVASCPFFTEDADFVVYMNAKDPTPSQEFHSREALAPVFAELNKYDVTTHFVGQSTVFTLTGHRGTGEAYRLAHHVTVDGGKRGLMVASLPRHVREDGRHVAVFGAPAQGRLVGGARTS